MEEQLLGYISHGSTGIGGAIMAMIGYKVLWERRSNKYAVFKEDPTTAPRFCKPIINALH